MTWRTIGVRICTVLAGVLALTLITSPASFGATRTMHDAKRDVYRPDRAQQHLVRGERPNGDITSVRTDHRARTVKVVVHLRKLRPGLNMVGIELITSAKHHPAFMITGVAADRAFTGAVLTKGAEREVECAGLRVRIDTAHATIRASVPRSCLGNPSWVRTGVMVMVVSKKQAADRPTIDVAGKTVITEHWWTRSKRLPLGSKVYVARMR